MTYLNAPFVIVILVGKTWNIPADSEVPKRGRQKHETMPLLKILREQKEMKLKGGIYHRTQIDLTYNSNHIEGSRLTHDQTRYIFETNTRKSMILLRPQTISVVLT